MAASTTATTSILRRVARKVADALMPPVCLACAKPLATPDALCAVCWRQVHFIRPPLCDRLGIPLPYDPGGRVVSALALANPPRYDRARAVAHFDHVMRKLVHRLKYADHHDGLTLMGRWLQSAGAELLGEADVLIPVPLNRWRLLSRRYNQAGLLAQELGRSTGLPYAPMILRRTRRTPSQVGLTRLQRHDNLSGAFMVPNHMKPVLQDQRVLLIDDVITTGATAEACARVLKRAGARSVDVLALGLVTFQSEIGADPLGAPFFMDR